MVQSGLRSALRVIFPLALMTLALAASARAADWSVPEQQLARKIASVTGPGAITLTVENRSSLSRRDYDIIRNGLRSALESAAIKVTRSEQATTVKISLSESLVSYVWVAEIHTAGGESSVAMVSMPRPDGTVSRDSVPLSLRKIPLWTSSDPILDISVLEDGSMPTRLAVLDPEKISVYRMQGGKWQNEQVLLVAHAHPWPRDLRGRLLPGKDHLLDAYLPGVICHSGNGSALTLDCRESDDPWPLLSGSTSGGLSVFPSASLANGASNVVPQLGAFFAPARNFFTGVLTPGVGKFTTVPKFYSAAVLPHEKFTLWLFATVDGQVHMIDGATDQAVRLALGSDLASVKTACGAGWQVLTTNAGENEDSIRAYEFPERDAIAVSPAIDLPGAVTALWTESRGDTAVVVTHDRETGSYEAFRVALSCVQ